MPIKKYKPTSPSRRQMSVSTFEEITTIKPEKSLLAPLFKKAGRNNQGKITVRHHGGGHKRKYRIIDFKRNKDGIAATWRRSNMIRTVHPTSLLSIMRMVRKLILSLRKA